MPVKKQRRDDRGPRRFKVPLHWLAGMTLGWHLAQMFPEYDRLLQVLGAGWVWGLSVLQGAGGLAVVVSSALGILQIYKYFAERKRNNGTN